MKDITILFSLANPISEKIMVHKLFVKMFLSNHIARFFDHQYLKERYHFFLTFAWKYPPRKVIM